MTAPHSNLKSKKDPYVVNTSGVLYGAYVFFEEMRMEERVSNSKMRLKIEVLCGRGIYLEREIDRLWTHKDDIVTHKIYSEFSVALRDY